MTAPATNTDDLAPGVYDLPADVYTALPYLNWSSLKCLHTSAKLMRHRADHPAPDKDAFRVGRGLHVSVLEPDTWAQRYIAVPSFGDMRTKAAKAKRDEWLGEVGDLNQYEVLSADEHALCSDVARNVHGHPGAADLLRGGKAEQTVIWIDDATGIRCKARLDYLRPTDFGDLKSTRRESVRMFSRDASSLLYHGQIAWYHAGAIAAGALPPDCDPPWVIAAQTVEPYDVMPFLVTPLFLEAGRTLCRSLLERYVACQAADWWPGLQEGIGWLDIEPWAAGLDEREPEEALDW